MSFDKQTTIKRTAQNQENDIFWRREVAEEEQINYDSIATLNGGDFKITDYKVACRFSLGDLG